MNATNQVRQVAKKKERRFRCRLKATVPAPSTYRNEAYTSKTCTNCGKVHEKLGGKKLMRCGCLPKSGKKTVKLCRDLNGARGIFIKSTLCEIPPAALVRRCIPVQTPKEVVSGVC